MDGIERALEILGLGPEATSEDIRQAFRDLAKVWHPDRFPNDPRIQQMAEEKLKEINLAYEILKDYDFSSRTGSAPHRDTSNGPEPDQDPPLHEAFNRGAAKSPFEPPDKGGTISQAPKPRGSFLWISIFLFTVISLLVFIIYAASHKKEESPSLPPGQDDVSQPSNKLSNHLSEKNKDKVRIGNNNFFTIGSTKDEVLAVQGTPTEPSEINWSYGLSQVYFRNGRVSGWYVNPLNPLRIMMLPSDVKMRSKGSITIGSTKDEVLAAQGIPTALSELTWSYGVSHVYFRNGRVSGWSVSPLNPLKVMMSSSD